MRMSMSMTVKQQHHDPGQSKTQDESNAYVGVDSASKEVLFFSSIGDGDFGIMFTIWVQRLYQLFLQLEY